MSYEMDTDMGDEQKAQSKLISFRFCRECSNMLYPKEDEANNQLMFACRMCSYSEKAEESTCIYRNALKEEIAETAGNVDDVKEDPTVGDSPDDGGYDVGAGYEGGYGYDSATEMEDAFGEETVPEMCTLCGKEILCPFCGRPTASGVALETHDPADATDSREEEEQVELERRERALSGAGLATS